MIYTEVQQFLDEKPCGIKHPQNNKLPLNPLISNFDKWTDAHFVYFLKKGNKTEAVLR